MEKCGYERTRMRGGDTCILFRKKLNARSKLNKLIIRIHILERKKNSEKEVNLNDVQLFFAQFQNYAL